MDIRISMFFVVQIIRIWIISIIRDNWKYPCPEIIRIIIQPIFWDYPDNRYPDNFYAFFGCFFGRSKNHAKKSRFAKNQEERGARAVASSIALNWSVFVICNEFWAKMANSVSCVELAVHGIPPGGGGRPLFVLRSRSKNHSKKG